MSTTDSMTPSRKRPRFPATDRPSYPRKRAAQACHTCRQKRIKCDNEHPSCGACTQIGVQCVYRENDKSTFDLASIAILQRLDVLEELLRGAIPASLAPHSTGPDLGPVPIQGQACSTPPLNNLDSPALERTQAGAGHHINIEIILTWPVFQNRGLEARLLQPLGALLQSRTREVPAEPQQQGCGLDFETSSARELFANFVQHVHIYNPVLEVEKIERDLRDALFDGFGWDARSALLLLIFALGSISGSHFDSTSTTSSAFLRSDEFTKAERYFAAAQKRLGALLCRDGVVEAQVFFYAGVYLMATLRPLEAWRMFVQALACCETFNSGQSPSAVHMHPYESATQQSIYWTCFKSELELRLELNIGRSCVLDLTYPALFPSPPTGLKSEEEAVWYFYLAEIALRRLGNRILNHLYSQENHDNHTQVEAALSFEEQASALLTSLPALLDLYGPSNQIQAPISLPTGRSTSPSPSTNPTTDSQHAAMRFILSGHLIDCYEMIYWPFVVAALHSSLPTPIFTTPSPDLSFSQFARKGFEICLRRITTNESGFYVRHHGTWLMLRSCTRSALVLIAAALGGLSDLLPGGWEGGVEKVMELLRYWTGEVGDVGARLEVLEKLMEGIPRGGA